MQYTAAFDVIFVGRSVICQLSAAKDESLLLGINARFFLDTFLYAPYGVRGVYVDLCLISS